MTSVVRDQELPHFREDPVPGGSKREPLLAEAGTSMHNGGTSVVTYLRKTPKRCTQHMGDRTEEM